MTTFTDDFNRADGSPGANWVQVSGTWSIITNRLSSGSAGGTIVIRAATAMSTNDNSAQVTIATTGAVSHGVWCRGNTTITQGYLWRNDGTSWNLFSVVGGSFVSVGSFAGAAVAGDVAKIQAVGSTIKGFVNGVQRVSVTDTAVTTGTSVGIRAESSNLLRFDDFTGADVTSGTTGDAALSSIATLSAAGLRATAGGAALAATAGLTAAGVRATGGGASLTALAGLAADGVRATAGGAALTSTAALTADGVRAASGGAGLASAAGLVADGVRATTGAAVLQSTSGLSADGTRGTSGDASLAASATLTASGTVATGATGDVAVSVTVVLAAAGAVGRGLDAAFTATVALTAVGAIGVTSGGSVAVSAGLTASGQVAGVVVRGTARGATGDGPRARRGEPALSRAQRGELAVPTARGGAL
jgi:hypothetical protein